MLGTALIARGSFAQTQPQSNALVVGVSSYENLPDLPSAVPDASLVGASFMQLGFETNMLLNPTKDEFLHGLANFQVSAASAPLTLVYIAAHGGISQGQTHIFLRDAVALSDRIPESVLLHSVNDQPRQRIMFMDTCRDSPIHGALPNRPSQQYRAGIHVSYATQPNAPAFDGGASNSPFALALQRALMQPGLELTQLTRRVRLDVIQATQGLQIPWDRSSLLLPVVLNSGS
jgi:uncharacterized caspase-like protein